MLNEKFTEEEIMASTFVFLRCSYLYTHIHTHTCMLAIAGNNLLLDLGGGYLVFSVLYANYTSL